MVAETFSISDIDALGGLGEALAAAPDLAAFRQRTVELLPAAVECSVAFWNEVDLGRHRIEAVLWPRPDPDLVRSLGTAINLLFDQPGIDYFVRTGDGRPVAISDFLAPEAFHLTDLYHRVYRPLGVEDQLSFVLPEAGGDAFVGVALSRGRPGFSARDRAVCRLLRSHLAQIYRAIQATRGRATSEPAAPAALTDRQAEVLSLLAGGRSTKQIGHLLGISPRTVDKHVGQILARLGVQSRLEAVAVVNFLDLRERAVATPGRKA